MGTWLVQITMWILQTGKLNNDDKRYFLVSMLQKKYANLLIRIYSAPKLPQENKLSFE
jgi:hypothetical protein